MKSSDDQQVISLRENVEIYFEADEPEIVLPFRQESNDDHLICSIRDYKANNPSHRVVLLSSDNGMGLTLFAKAKKHGIEQRELPDGYKNSLPEDPQAKEIKQLKNEIVRLSTSEPKLDCFFADGGTSLHRIVADPPRTTLKEFIEAVRRDYPLLVVEGEQGFAHGRIFLNPTASMATPQQRHNWNEEIEVFYQQMATYFESKKQYVGFVNRGIEIPLCLYNSGVRPAHNIDVTLYFPVSDYLEEEKIKEPDEPEKPTIYRHDGLKNVFALTAIFAAHQKSLALNALAGRYENPSLIVGRRSDIGFPSFRQTEQYSIVSFRVSEVKHTFRIDFYPLYYVVPEGLSTRFSVKYKLVANETPKPIEGELTVILDDPLEALMRGHAS